MRYALLIYQTAEFERYWASASDEEKRELYAEYDAFGKLLEARGALVDGNELALSPTARTVRKNGAEALVTSGPFAETAEQLGGYFVVDVRDIDAALELARALPSEVVEVREIVPAPDTAR